jgi:hypothetical protein
VSLLIDGEATGAVQAALFRHLGECADCRLFFDSMVRFRNSAGHDREEIFRAADEALPARLQLPPVREAARDFAPVAGLGRWFPFATGGWRLPVPAAIGLALVLLVGGVILGSSLSRGPGGDGSRDRAGALGQPTVVVVCSLPEVEVR